MTNYAAYKDPAHGGRWTLDVDPDDEVNYAPDVGIWLRQSSTMALSFETIPSPGVAVLEQEDPQGLLGELLPVKLKVSYASDPEPHLTLRVSTADNQKFNKTVWFKKVKN